MTKYVAIHEQTWEPADVLGLPMERCLLWEGQHKVFAGLFRMPGGMKIPAHHHPQWVQILVLSGKLQVEEAGAQVRTITSGGYYFVEPGDSHVETALEDTLLLVVAEDDRSPSRRQSSLF
jgi:quercetin dioxygenase-like cupin family protein